MKTSTIEKCVKATGILLSLIALGFLVAPLIAIYTGKTNQGTNEFHDQYVVISYVVLLLVSIFLGLGVLLFFYARKITLLIMNKTDSEN